MTAVKGTNTESSKQTVVANEHSTIERALGCVELSSLPAGYRTLEILTRDSTLHVLEASPAGAGRFMVLYEGNKESAKSFQHLLHSQLNVRGAGSEIIDHEVCPSHSAQIIEAVYSLAQVPLEESLIVLECDTISALLSASHVLLENYDLKPIEIKISRAFRGGGHAFFTGSAEKCGPAGEDVRTRLTQQMRSLSIDVIDQPGSRFRQYFNFSGEI